MERELGDERREEERQDRAYHQINYGRTIAEIRQNKADVDEQLERRRAREDGDSEPTDEEQEDARRERAACRHRLYWSGDTRCQDCGFPGVGRRVRPAVLEKFGWTRDGDKWYCPACSAQAQIDDMEP